MSMSLGKARAKAPGPQPMYIDDFMDYNLGSALENPSVTDVMASRGPGGGVITTNFPGMAPTPVVPSGSMPSRQRGAAINPRGNMAPRQQSKPKQSKYSSHGKNGNRGRATPSSSSSSSSANSRAAAAGKGRKPPQGQGHGGHGPTRSAAMNPLMSIAMDSIAMASGADSGGGGMGGGTSRSTAGASKGHGQGQGQDIRHMYDALKEYSKGRTAQVKEASVVERQMASIAPPRDPGMMRLTDYIPLHATIKNVTKARARGLNDHFAIAVGSLGEDGDPALGRRLVNFSVVECLGTCFMVNITVPALGAAAAAKPWVVFVSAGEETRQVMRVWGVAASHSSITQGNPQTNMAMWLLQATTLHFAPAPHGNTVVAHSFNMDSFLMRCRKEIEGCVNKSLTLIQKIARGRQARLAYAEKWKRADKVKRSIRAAQRRVRDRHRADATARGELQQLSGAYGHGDDGLSALPSELMSLLPGGGKARAGPEVAKELQMLGAFDSAVLGLQGEMNHLGAQMDDLDRHRHLDDEVVDDEEREIELLYERKRQELLRQKNQRQMGMSISTGSPGPSMATPSGVGGAYTPGRFDGTALNMLSPILSSPIRTPIESMSSMYMQQQQQQYQSITNSSSGHPNGYSVGPTSNPSSLATAQLERFGPAAQRAESNQKGEEMVNYSTHLSAPPPPSHHPAGLNAGLTTVSNPFGMAPRQGTPVAAGDGHEDEHDNDDEAIEIAALRNRMKELQHARQLKKDMLRQQHLAEGLLAGEETDTSASASAPSSAPVQPVASGWKQSKRKKSVLGGMFEMMLGGGGDGSGGCGQVAEERPESDAASTAAGDNESSSAFALAAMDTPAPSSVDMETPSGLQHLYLHQHQHTPMTPPHDAPRPSDMLVDMHMHMDAASANDPAAAVATTASPSMELTEAEAAQISRDIEALLERKANDERAARAAQALVRPASPTRPEGDVPTAVDTGSPTSSVATSLTNDISKFGPVPPAAGQSRDRKKSMFHAVGSRVGRFFGVGGGADAGAPEPHTPKTAKNSASAAHKNEMWELKSEKAKEVKRALEEDEQRKIAEQRVIREERARAQGERDAAALAAKQELDAAKKAEWEQQARVRREEAEREEMNKRLDKYYRVAARTAAEVEKSRKIEERNEVQRKKLAEDEKDRAKAAAREKKEARDREQAQIMTVEESLEAARKRREEEQKQEQEQEKEEQEKEKEELKLVWEKSRKEAQHVADEARGKADAEREIKAAAERVEREAREAAAAVAKAEADEKARLKKDRDEAERATQEAEAAVAAAEAQCVAEAGAAAAAPAYEAANAAAITIAAEARRVADWCAARIPLSDANARITRLVVSKQRRMRALRAVASAKALHGLEWAKMKVMLAALEDKTMKSPKVIHCGLQEALKRKDVDMAIAAANRLMTALPWAQMKDNVEDENFVLLEDMVKHLTFEFLGPVFRQFSAAEALVLPLVLLVFQVSSLNVGWAAHLVHSGLVIELVMLMVALPPTSKATLRLARIVARVAQDMDEGKALMSKPVNAKALVAAGRFNLAVESVTEGLLRAMFQLVYKNKDGQESIGANGGVSYVLDCLGKYVNTPKISSPSMKVLIALISGHDENAARVVEADNIGHLTVCMDIFEGNAKFVTSLCQVVNIVAKSSQANRTALSKTALYVSLVNSVLNPEEDPEVVLAAVTTFPYFIPLGQEALVESLVQVMTAFAEDVSDSKKAIKAASAIGVEVIKARKAGQEDLTKVGKKKKEKKAKK